jgi:pSer/pThr/pTyr-binding forkhead associated (FHA) protein
MSLLQAKLTQLESRLQSLIEGSAALLAPLRSEPDDLPGRLVAAMKAGIEAGENGELWAPNLFTLTVYPAYAQPLIENRILLESLAKTIEQTGLEAGLRFYSEPYLKVAIDPAIAPGQISIRATVSSQVDDTSTLTFDPGQEAAFIPENAFLIVGGMQVFPLSQAVINIGRRPDNHLVIDDLRVSRVHAQLRVSKGRFVLFDLDSTGGTFVNEERIKRCTLYPGDVISLSGVNLVFGQDAANRSGTTQSSTGAFEPPPDRD